MQSVETILDFLPCPTPKDWIEYAINNLELLLIDHAHCEKKAASTAFSMLYRYPDQYPLIIRMSKIAREELRHFEQVLKIMKRRNIDFRHLTPSRYAGGLLEGLRSKEPNRLVDNLIVGAFIEARSCERFASIAPYLDAELSDFYCGLLSSEARHFRVYLELAQLFSTESIEDRVKTIRAKERSLIESLDDTFRFHSGIPI